jgi:hypothetical protein
MVGSHFGITVKRTIPSRGRTTDDTEEEEGSTDGVDRAK